MDSSQPNRPFIPFSRPTLGVAERDEVVDSMLSGWITTGPKVRKFEAMLAYYLGVPEVVAVSSATAAWHLLVAAMGIGPGDEVIFPAITWPSMPNMVELAGAKAVFADVDPHTLQIDPLDVARLLNDRTRAVVPVHFAGAPYDVDAVSAAIGSRPIELIDDSAHALGTEYRGRLVGSEGRTAIFSFHAGKNITTGEGGAVACSDTAMVKRLRLLRSHGVTRDAWGRVQGTGSADFEIPEPGYKYNMMDLQAAMGIHQLPALGGFNARRALLAACYDKGLESIAGVRPLGTVAYPHTHAHHLYIVRVNEAVTGICRDQFIHELGERRIGAGLHFPAVHLKHYYKEKYLYTKQHCPHAAELGASIVSLPLYPGLNEADVQRVCAAIAEIVSRKIGID